ncbi:GRP family sugar transporter [Patescibacteria group bacterium]
MSLTSIPWQILIVLGALLTTVSLTLNKYQAHRGSAIQTQSVKYFGCFVWMTIWWTITSRQIPSDWWIYSIYGMFVTLSLVAYTKAQRISMSQTSLMEPVGQLLGILLAAIVINEWRLFTGQSGFQLLLALLLMPVLLWTLYEYKSVHSKKWLQLVLIFLIMLAVFKVVVKLFLNSAQAVEVLMFQYLGAFIAGVGGVLFKKQQKLFNRKFILRGIMQGWIGSSGILLMYTAIKLTTVTQTTLLRTPLILVLKTMSGLLLFKEMKKMTKKKWLGVGVALVITFLVITASH